MTRVFLKFNPDIWAATHAYTLGSQIQSHSDLYLQQVTTPGTSGASIPTFNTVTGGTTTDGTVVWTCVGSTATPVWLVPPGWNNTNNSIEVIGAGSNGGSNASSGGGGGGAYSKISNLTLTPGSYIPYSVGAALTSSASPGGDTWFNGSTYGASSVAAKGGQAAGTTGPGLGGDSSLGIGTVKYSGAPGASAGGGVFTDGGGGGGGAAGPFGPGVTGPGGPQSNIGAVGGAGGAADAGNISAGFGGSGGLSGSNPSGGGAGGNGAEWGYVSMMPPISFGSGGGAGGGGVGQSATNGLGGTYGGGGGGGSLSASISAGGNGILVITFTTYIPPPVGLTGAIWTD